MTATALPTAAPTMALLPVYKRAPMELVRGAGVELFDAEGNAYLDFTSGIGVNALGYGDAGVAAAARDALDAGLVHVSNLFRSAPGERLAELLVARSFASTVFFCNSGAEANEGAFKLARRWARGVGGAAKHEILALRGGFHGRLFATLAATDRPAYRAPFRPLAGGISIVERDLASLEGALDPATVAAVIVEPVQGEGGVRVLDDAFLRELRALTRSRNVLLILDEIQCGLGRTGRLWAYEHSGIEPDLMTLAKPLAGGLPMGAVLASAEVSSQMQPGDHGSTFGGGPLVASVALHVVERLSDPTLLAHVREEGAWLAEQLASLMRPTGRVRAVRGTGLMWGVDVSVPAAEVVTRAREIGLLLCTAGDHTLRLLPPLIIAHEELARGMELFEESLA
ncbi:MAG TPA: acetylornithine transaminase [Gemmatimonadaceae bacterium]|jgi:acetylornithine/N-succinyldiaminopimelate aminotransferase|nr:acetylornithine transaminase [Gemmatimonadaceae bacterium]